MATLTAMILVSGLLTSLSTPGTSFPKGDSASNGKDDGTSTINNITCSDATCMNQSKISITNTTEVSQGSADRQTTSSEEGSPQFRYMIFALSFSITTTLVFFVGAVITWKVLRKKYANRHAERKEPDGIANKQDENDPDMEQPRPNSDTPPNRSEPDGVVSNAPRQSDPSTKISVPGIAVLPGLTDQKTDEHVYEILNDGYERPVNKEHVLFPLGSSPPQNEYVDHLGVYNASSGYAMVTGPQSIE